VQELPNYQFPYNEITLAALSKLNTSVVKHNGCVEILSSEGVPISRTFSIPSQSS
jgi:hypothetical protein